MRPKRGKQHWLPVSGKGGWRPRAGRKKRSKWVNHVKRPEFSERFPVHVTWHAVAGVGNLREKKRWNEIKKAFFLGHEKFGMRMVEFTVQSNHVHFVVEAAGKQSLTRGMQGLAIRIAKAINRASGRHGKVFRDRYDARILRTVAQVRNAVNYVRRNLQHHNKLEHPWFPDPCSSMDGEACYLYWDDPEIPVLLVSKPRTWLLQHAG
jgi:REP-associated tyrosine transposase